MSTFMAKAETIERNWYVIDASGKKLGRLATQVATILRGKHKAIYTPHCDTGDFVIIINTDKVELTGKKLDQKVYRKHTGYVGGLKEISYKSLMAEKSDFAVYEAVRRMMPKTPLGRAQMKKLRVYKGAEHMHAAQKPVELEIQ